MTKLHPCDLSPELLSAANELYQFDGALPSSQQEYGYFSAERVEKPLGRASIVMTQGGYDDDGGYESYASQITLNFRRDGSLRSINQSESFEPDGPLLALSGMVSEPRETVSRLFRTISRAERASEKASVAQRASSYILRTLSLIESNSE